MTWLKLIIKIFMKVTSKVCIMSTSNVRPKSASPPPDDLSLVPNLDTWMGSKTFFLDKMYQLEEMEPFDVFSFCHTEQQKSGNVYDIGGRFWKQTTNIIYYVRKVTVLASCLQVVIAKMWRDGLKVEDNINLVFNLDDGDFAPLNPFYQDWQARRECVETFQQYKDTKGKPMPLTQIVEFFNACLYLLIANSYKNDPECDKNTKRKFNDNRLQRLTKNMMSMWDNYPDFAKRFSRQIIPIEDQNLCRIPEPETSFGSMIVVIPLNMVPEDYAQFVVPDKNGKRNYSEIEKWIKQGKDPLPILLGRISKSERDRYPTKVDTVRSFHW